MNATSTVRSPSQGRVLCQEVRASKRTGEAQAAEDSAPIHLLFNGPVLGLNPKLPPTKV